VPSPDPGLPHLASGKVRDIFSLDADHLVLVASDRISAFDVVMDEPIPDKGRVLTAMSAFWFRYLDGVANHLVDTALDALPVRARLPGLAGRIMVCRRAEMLPIECIVRGHLTGSAWREYRTRGTVHGQALPAGMQESEPLPEPIFTPSTKSASGHDVNISYDEAADLVGQDAARRARDLSLEVFRRGVARATEQGIVIADTKLEVGYVDGELVVADEVLTPDSSRFWPRDEVVPGATPPSFDKQPLRDHLDALGWDKAPPPPPLSEAVVAATRARYVTAYERVTGASFADWPGVGS
jgi:phosphoribosylaminoimidazole-succinocarboxamide synthase